MKTIPILLVPIVAACLLLAQPAQAQSRDTTVRISNLTVAGPLPHHHSTIHRGHPPHHRSYHVPRQHRSHRHAHRNEQIRMAEWYASTTLSQVSFARRVGCAGSHPRWSTSYQDHYHWAYGSSRHQIMREIEIRDRALASCGYYRR